MIDSKPLLEVSVVHMDHSCPFDNKEVHLSLSTGECLWLKGASGSGKTTLAKAISHLEKLPGATLNIQWDPTIPPLERIGFLFQQGVLIDSLNTQENILLSAKAARNPWTDEQAWEQLHSVGLHTHDLFKMPGQLSGGMLHRAALAQVLTQNKRVVVLDEPFIGLDKPTAMGIIEKLKELKKQGIAFILIAHEEEYASLLADEHKQIELHSAETDDEPVKHRSMPRYHYGVRILLRFWDYFILSLPLIICAFLAAGFAISLAFAQMIQQLDPEALINRFLSHGSLFIRLFMGEIDKMQANFLPAVKEKLYAGILAQVFTTQLGPLLTALLLAGRIGGSYAGEVSMMRATSQTALLKTLGINPRAWNLLPAMLAAAISAPLLSLIGTAAAGVSAAIVAVRVGIIKNSYQFWHHSITNIKMTTSIWNFSIFINIYRSLAFMVLIIVIAEICANRFLKISPRNVPKIITWSVVGASLAIIFADWGMTEWLFHFLGPSTFDLLPDLSN